MKVKIGMMLALFVCLVICGCDGDSYETLVSYSKVKWKVTAITFQGSDHIQLSFFNAKYGKQILEIGDSNPRWKDYLKLRPGDTIRFRIPGYGESVKGQNSARKSDFFNDKFLADPEFDHLELLRDTKAKG